jgi:hypothetical protein
MPEGGYLIVFIEVSSESTAGPATCFRWSCQTLLVNLPVGRAAWKIFGPGSQQQTGFK